MILTDREIQIAIDQGAVVIDPPPGEHAYSSTSLDLRLDQNLSEFKESIGGIQRVIEPGHRDYDHETILGDITHQVSIDPVKGYIFEPGKLILAWTREYIELTPAARLAARVEGKSSLARLGIGVHITAPTIHAGFTGQIRLEMMNHGRLPVILKCDMPICQLIFEQTLGTPVRSYKGRFLGQVATKRG